MEQKKCATRGRKSFSPEGERAIRRKEKERKVYCYNNGPRMKNRRQGIPLDRKSLSPGISLGNTPLPIRTGHRNLLISSDEYPVKPAEWRGGCGRVRVVTRECGRVTMV